MTCRQAEAGCRGLVFGCFRFFHFFSIFFAFSLPDVVARVKRDCYRKWLAEHFGFENANKWIVCIKFVQSASKRAVNVRNCEKEVPKQMRKRTRFNVNYGRVATFSKESVTKYKMRPSIKKITSGCFHNSRWGVLRVSWSGYKVSGHNDQDT